MRKTTFCAFENKGVDQLHGNREADQHLCFQYTDSTIPLLPTLLVCVCDFTGWFGLDLVRNHIVGFLMTRHI